MYRNGCSSSVIVNVMVMIRMHYTWWFARWFACRWFSITHWIMSTVRRLILQMFARRYRCARRFIRTIFRTITWSENTEDFSSYQNTTIKNIQRSKLSAKRAEKKSISKYRNEDKQKNLPFRWVSIILICTQTRIGVFVWHSQCRTIKWTQTRARWWHKISHAQARHHPIGF